MRFKCSVDIYASDEPYERGDMVIVNCDRGYNVGFVDREVKADEIPPAVEDESSKPKKILNHVKDEDQSIRNMLRSKISAENYALTQCKSHIRGRRLAVFSDIIATDFQFDRKKLMVYIKKYEDVSVCRLVRKLYETFKMRIKVHEVADPQLLYDMAVKYHELAKLDLPFNEIFDFDPRTASVPFLRPQVYQGNSRNYEPVRRQAPAHRQSTPEQRSISDNRHVLPANYHSNYYHQRAPIPYMAPESYRPQRQSAPPAEYSHAFVSSRPHSITASHDIPRDWQMQTQQDYSEFCPWSQSTSAAPNSLEYFPSEEQQISSHESYPFSRSNLWTSSPNFP